MEKSTNIPNPKDWEWDWNECIKYWAAFCTDLHDVSTGGSLLTKFGCKNHARVAMSVIRCKLDVHLFGYDCLIMTGFRK